VEIGGKYAICFIGLGWMDALSIMFAPVIFTLT